jgi:hypothetical protein
VDAADADILPGNLDRYAEPCRASFRLEPPHRSGPDSWRRPRDPRRSFAHCASSASLSDAAISPPRSRDPYKDKSAHRCGHCEPNGRTRRSREPVNDAVRWRGMRGVAPVELGAGLYLGGAGLYLGDKR